MSFLMQSQFEAYPDCYVGLYMPLLSPQIPHTAGDCFKVSKLDVFLYPLYELETNFPLNLSFKLLSFL